MDGVILYWILRLTLIWGFLLGVAVITGTGFAIVGITYLIYKFDKDLKDVDYGLL